MAEHAQPRDLTAVFDPTSVAVVGASDDQSKYGNWLAAQALRMSDRREVHLVNHRGGRVLGRPARRSLSDLGSPVDLAVLTVPAPVFEGAVEDALAAGVRAVIAVTAGFAEAGDEGRALQERVVGRIRAAGAVLVGPNCLGVLDSTTAVTLTSNAMPSGRIALLSQSGNVALELSNLLRATDEGFSRFVSLGNQADLDVADFIEDCADHDGTDLIAVYSEDFRDGRRFVRAAARAHAQGKPVVLLTVGGSEASIRGAQSHTGAMTTRSAVVDAACEAGGVERVSSPARLVAAARALLRHPVGAPVRRLGVVADGGGHVSLASDLAEAAGVLVPSLGHGSRARLTGALPGSACVDNPVDIGAGPTFALEAVGEVADVLVDDEQVDAVLVTGYFGGYHEYGPDMARREMETAARLAATARRSSKPLLVHSMYPTSAAARSLIHDGVAVFADIDDAVSELAVLRSHHAPRPPLPDDAGRASVAPQTDSSYWAARRLLAEAGVSFPAGRLVQDRTGLEAAARAVGLPVALKATGLLHKSDAGGVVLGLEDLAALLAAYDALIERLGPRAVTVEAMVETGGGVELLLGAQRDPRFGCVVTLGLGGVLTEALDDVTVALGPVDERTATAMLTRLRASALLGAYRGRPALDVAAAARAVATFSQVAAAHPELVELEINPLLVRPDGVIGLDARIVVDNAPEEAWTSH